MFNTSKLAKTPKICKKKKPGIGKQVRLITNISIIVGQKWQMTLQNGCVTVELLFKHQDFTTGYGIGK